MFLDFINLVKTPITSAARNKTLFQNTFFLQTKIKSLSLRQNWKAGRSTNGRIIFWTKTSLLKRYKTVKVNYKINCKRLSFIASFQFISFKNKLLSLLYFSNGALTYYISTENHILFDYTYLNFNKKLRNFFENSYWSPLFLLKKLIFISFIEISPLKNAQYCLGSGTRAKVLTIDKTTCAVMIQLPSKIKKIISYYSYVFVGRIALEEKKKYKNTRSGYWRSFGEKSIVRGVAMNAVDHPHGGRTKSIRYPQTPWGKTTKYK